MTVFHLFDNLTATNTVPPVSVNPDNLNLPSMGNANRTFSVLLTGIGSCSCTVQPLGSNDGTNWQNDGPSIAVTASSADVTPGQGNAGASQHWRFYGAILTAIAGTSAAATCLLVA